MLGQGLGAEGLAVAVEEGVESGYLLGGVLAAERASRGDGAAKALSEVGVHELDRALDVVVEVVEGVGRDPELHVLGGADLLCGNCLP